MEIVWDEGRYVGEVKDGVPCGNGVLFLPNGIKRGVWKNGVMVQGIQYVSDTLYLGSYDEQGNFHGKGYFEKENVLTWQGEWEHGKIVSDDLSGTLPNCVFIGSYYGGIKPKHLNIYDFPQKGKIHRDGYYGMMVDADRYEMPLLSNAFGIHIVCAVEHPNNRWDYSKGRNNRALFFCDPDGPNMFTDAWVVKWEKDEYAPLTPQEAFDINNFIHETLAYENIEDFGNAKKKFADRKFLLLDDGIYKGDLDEQGNPTGDGWIVYNHDDKQGRALYKGKVKNGIPEGYGELVYRKDAENCRYSGNFRNGLFHTVGTGGYGKASLVKQNGQDWYGVWVDGEFEGEENAIAIGGWAYERYDGKFVKSQLVYGTHSNPTDERGKYRYEGEFFNFLPHGYGTETIADVSWTGHFVNGKRLVGDGQGATKNAIELFDPYVAKNVNFEDFGNTALALQLVTQENALQFVCNDKVKELSKKVGGNLTLVCANTDGKAINKFAKELFDVDVTGSCVVCSKAENGVGALPPKVLVKLMTVLQQQTEKLQQQIPTDCYTIATLDEKHTSDWDVTRETHDDYPLEANHDFFAYYHYLVQLGDEYYCAQYDTFASYEWKASNQNDEVFNFAHASAKLHKLPKGLTNFQQIKDYCQKQNKWTDTIKTDTVRSYETYSSICKNGGFLPLLMKKFFGKTLAQKDADN